MAQDKLKLLEELQQASVHSRRRAAVAAWIALAIAGAGTVALVGYSARTVGELRAQTVKEQGLVEDLRKQRRTLVDERQRLADEIDTLRPTLANYQACIAADTAKSIQVRGEQPPSPATVARARIYLQVVDENDRQYAQDIGRRLAGEFGYTVPGVEYVRGATRLRNTEVRYYKRAEEEGARRIVEALTKLGVPPPGLLYLNLENARVRPNHYEVWFAAGAGRATPPA